MGTLKWLVGHYKMKATIPCDEKYTGIVSSLTSSLQKHGVRNISPVFCSLFYIEKIIYIMTDLLLLCLHYCVLIILDRLVLVTW